MGAFILAALVWEILNEQTDDANFNRVCSSGGYSGHNRMGVLMLWTAVKSYFACAWSAFSYLIFGMPKDKQSYWGNKMGFNDSSPDLIASWAAYNKYRDFHHLKDILIEWVRVWPQRSGKILAMVGCVLSIITFGLGLLIGLIF